MTSSSSSSLHPILQACSSEFGGEDDDSLSVLNCVTSNLQATDETLELALNFVFLLFATSLVFLMQAGFAMLCAGSVRLKNVQNTMLKNLLDACGAAIGFWSFGYAFAYSSHDDDNDERGGGTSFLGRRSFGLAGVDPSDWGFWLFQFAFAATCATIVAGTLAERCQMSAYLCYSLVLTGFVYPVVVRAVWSSHGFLNATNDDAVLGCGMLDFAGSGVVHMTGGFTALLASWLLGPRKGRFHDNRGNKLDLPKSFPGHSPALQVLGTFILWFGWYGFNAGSIVAIAGRGASSGYPASHISSLAAVNTTLSASAGCVSALFTRLYFNERYTGEATFDLVAALNGTLSGLVAITGCCVYVEPWASIVIGVISGWIYLAASNLLIRLCIDDAVDAIPVHFANGMWGVLAVGLFATETHLQNHLGDDGDGDGDNTLHLGWFYEWGRGSADGTLLAVQILGILFIVAWVIAIMSPFFLLLNYVGCFRADSLEEVVGLDISYHGSLQSLLMKEDIINPKDMEAYRERRRAKNRALFGSNHSGSAYSNSYHSTHTHFSMGTGTGTNTKPSPHVSTQLNPTPEHPVLTILSDLRQNRNQITEERTSFSEDSNASKQNISDGVKAPDTPMVIPQQTT